MTNTIIETIEKSEMWKNLNEKVKNLCNEYGIEQSTEEYQALRNMIICKVMAEDKKVYETFAKETYETLKA